MIKQDATAFQKEMSAFAEAMDRRPIGSAALEHWFDALQGFSLSVIKDAIQRWERTKSKFPTISEMVRECAELSSIFRENFAHKEKESLSYSLNTIANRSPDTAALVNSLISRLTKKTEFDHKKWARDILIAHYRGDCLRYTNSEGHEIPITSKPIAPLQLAAARTALPFWKPPERQPGEDWEEDRA